MKRVSLAVLLCLFLHLCSSSVSASPDSYMFKRLSFKEGLSHSQVNYIFKDSQGFMWFSTAGGLNRYDGYTFKVFRHNEGNNRTVCDNFCEDVQEDELGQLWIKTASGYSIFRPDDEIFDNQPQKYARQHFGLPADFEVCYIDRHKNFWFAVPQVALYLYQPDTKKLTAYSQSKGGKLPAGNITDIRDTKNGAVVLYDNGRVAEVNTRIGKVTAIHSSLIPILNVQSEKMSLFVDNDGDFWVYTKEASGVFHYSMHEKRWRQINARPGESPYVLTSSVVQDITQDKEGQIWLATDHGGVDIIDKKIGLLRNLQNDPADQRSLPHNSINCVLADDMNMVWIGTYKKGIAYYSPSLFKFAVERFATLNRQTNFEPDITFIEEDKNEELWLGTNGFGLIQMNQNTKERKRYVHQSEDATSLSANVIVGLCAARDGKLWIGTYWGGLDCFDGKRFTHYRHQPGVANSLSCDNVWSIAEDGEGHIWIGTLGGGLQRLNPRTGEFITYLLKDHPEMGSDYIASVVIGKDGNILVGTAIGLSVFDPKEQRFKHYDGNKRGDQLFCSQSINQVYEDSRGLLWIATRDGLSVFDRKLDQVTSFRREQGLVDDIVSGVIEDGMRNLWVTTSNGVSNIHVTTDAKTGRYAFSFLNYGELDGLQNREFNIRSLARTYRGEILLGGASGMNHFFPDRIKYNEIRPRVTFTDLMLFNQEVMPDSVYDGHKILSKAFHLTDTLELDYKQNVFTIGFSAMNYVLPENATYAYKLEGFNSDWLIADKNTRRVTYTNLSPGTYRFMVKAANNDNYWNEEPRILTIIIRPPFWRTGWAYCFYVLVIAGMLYGARRRIIRAERNKVRIHQIEQEAKRNHELDDMKLRFFTNISHELRTPLTLILAPLDKMLHEEKREEVRQKYILMRRNALRLLNLVNQLLDFRKSDVQGHQLNSSKGDIIDFLHNACNSFVELSERKNIYFTFDAYVSSCLMEFDAEKMNQVIMNLLSNAFKFTPDGGSISVQVRMLPGGTRSEFNLEIDVTDTGIGIPEVDKPKVFDRFFQVQHVDTETYGGSGIGLQMVKEFVELHGGTVKVVDNDRALHGSKFVMILPIHTGEEGTVQMVKGEVFESYDLKTPVVDTPSIPMPRRDAKAPLILLVDDNEDFRSLMRETLEQDYNIQEACDGQEAWTLLPELQPDIVISDVMMPRMDGCELCRLVKTDIRTSHIPLILLTARTAEEHKIEGLEQGADDYITKPFNWDILSLRIKKLLEKNEQKRDTFHQQIEVNPGEITITSLDEKLLNKALKYVEENIGRSDLSVEELSKELGMSRVHLYKKLMYITGKSPVEFIRILRLKRAAQLLAKSQQNVSEVAYQVGFNNPKYFSKYFKEEFGVLPSVYQQQKEKSLTVNVYE